MQGFRAADAAKATPWFGSSPSYAMPPNWHRNAHEWQLKYTHPALRNAFTLEVFNNNGLVLLRLVEDTSLAETGGLNVHVRFRTAMWPCTAMRRPARKLYTPRTTPPMRSGHVCHVECCKDDCCLAQIWSHDARPHFQARPGTAVPPCSS